MAVKSFGDGPVIDAIVLSDNRSGFSPNSAAARRPLRPAVRPVSRMQWLIGPLVIVSACLLVLVLSAFGGDLAGLFGGQAYDALEFGPIKTEIHQGVDGKTLVVEGAILNRSDEVVALPAIRLALRTEERESYSWTVEPTARTLGPGASIGFRSLVVPPDPADGDVIVSLAPRQNDVIGLR